MNKPDQRLEFLIRDLPSPESARRFYEQFAERNPSQTARLLRNEGLFSDVLTLASYSPLLAATLIQNPDYVSWLAGKRSESAVQNKEELLESLARFALTHSQIEPHVLLARFRRRELLRIFLRDIRRLGTIAEITEEISNLADAILEHAVRLARQEMDNRYGTPAEVDEKGRQKPSDVCVVALGKLGSKELNYSSDIDLLFIYSSEGSTTGTGSREPVTNREYFVKFAETVTQLVGRQTGEGAAYRVDMRLRPHGRVGALALSLRETVRYYLNDARNWEQQVLIRSRASAGDTKIYRDFFDSVEETVFRKGRDAEEALREVFLSKEKIDKNRRAENEFDVKLGPGGIREIEFIAQALQLAHGGDDRWLRVPHTLISVSRLADRRYLTEDERSHLSAAYDFLRRLEHILQMEHGLQTHAVPAETEKRGVVSAKMGLGTFEEFETALASHTGKVHETFLRIFGSEAAKIVTTGDSTEPHSHSPLMPEQPERVRLERHLSASLEKYGAVLDEERADVIRRVSAASPKFAQLIASRPWLIEHVRQPDASSSAPDYLAEFTAAIDPEGSHASVLRGMRTAWSRLLLDIAIADIYETLSVSEVRLRQTLLAEASIEIAVREMSRRHASLNLALDILALGKLGSGTLDYDSDLDIIIAYPNSSDASHEMAVSEMYSRAAETFITLLSAMTRDGNLYRVDLRLRPYGKNGPNVTTVEALTDYIANNASIWELLAYVQLRSVKRSSGDIEASIRDAIKRRVSCEDPARVKQEARGMRLKLEKAHGSRGRDVDIKFGAGGLLDVYFVVRYLQLVNPESIRPEARSTPERLDSLRSAGILSSDHHLPLSQGHTFLSALDHNLRLSIGRSARFPRANRELLEWIAARMKMGAVEDIEEQLSIHRMNIRATFESVFGEIGPE